MKDKFTIEEIESAIQATRNGKLCIPEKIIAELTKSEFQPPNGQVYRTEKDNRYYLNTYRHNNFTGCRPLTTKEAGEESMQHLVNVLKNIKFQTTMYGNAELAHNESKGALIKHQELMI